MTATVPDVEAVPSPSAAITLRRVSAMSGVIVTVVGEVGRSDAAVLHRCLLAELGVPPAVMVLNLTSVTSCEVALLEVVDDARRRAEAEGVGLYQLDGPGPREVRG